MKISVVLFENFELLDVFGPVELFSLVEGWDVEFLSETAGPVASSQGVKVLADKSFADFEGADLLIVPGGRGTRVLTQDKIFLGNLKAMASKVGTLASICTGATLLAAAGLLED